MIPFLLWAPAVASLILGTIYLFLGDGRPPFKILGTLVFAVAVYLQFFSSHVLAGLLVQCVLALLLAIWRRAGSSI